MPPVLKQLILDHFQLVFTGGVLMIWLVLIHYQSPALKMIRRLTLLVFTWLSFAPFKALTYKMVSYIDIVEIDVLMRRYVAQQKGTDWVDGFFWGIATLIYLGLLGVLWAKDLSK